MTKHEISINNIIMNTASAKLRWLVTMLLLATTMVMPASTWAQEMYTVFDTTTGTLTFKYDNNKPASTDAEKVFAVPTESQTTPGWVYGLNTPVKIVVFDSSFANALPTSCYKWFYSYKDLTEIKNIENLNTTRIKDMWRMFYGCSGLTSLDLSSFNTTNVKTMEEMFYGCSKLASLTLPSGSTANVENMGGMFRDCSSLTSLTIPSSFNTANVKNMSYMFSLL